MDTQMKKGGNGGRAALGFFLTFFMIMTLTANSLIMGVKTTILNGSDVSEVLENMNIYQMMSDLITSEISKGTDAGADDGADVSMRDTVKLAATEDIASSDSSSSLKLSDETVQAIFGKETLKSVTKTLTDAIKNNQDVDLTGTKEQCVANAEQLAMQLIDDVIDEIENMDSDTISADSLKQLNTVQKMKNEYSVDVDTIITDYVKDNHGADSIKKSDVDFDSIRTSAKDTVKNDVMPELEKTIDQYVTELNDTVNKSIKEANEAYNLSGVINGIEAAIKGLGIAMIICIVLAIAFAALEIVVYRQAINKGFRNIFIGTLISGVFTLLMSILVGVIKSIFLSAMGGDTDAVSMAVSKMLSDNIGAVGDRMMLIAIVYIVIGVACLIASIVIKKKINNNNDVNGMGTLSDGSVMA